MNSDSSSRDAAPLRQETNLFFDGHGSAQGASVSLSEVLVKMEREIRSMLPDRIEVELETSGEVLPHIALRPAQAQDLIRHLVIDALDAMPGAGTLLIFVGETATGAGYPPLPSDLPPGSWVMLSVSDTGIPSTPAPTEAPSPLDKGRALGLSAAYEALQRSGGYLSVALRGQETAVRMYFPVATKLLEP